jgi:hypothetical protein
MNANRIIAAALVCLFAVLGLEHFRVSALQAHGGKPLFGATISEQGVRLNQVAKPNAAVDLNGQKLTTVANGTASGDAVQLGQIAVKARAVTTASLPAYTYSNGSSGVNATITANSNGACPASSFDGVTLAVPDVVLVQNGASFADNWLYVVTAPLGDGSNPCKLTRLDIADSQAEILGQQVRIAEGLTRAGAVYAYSGASSITMGTTPLSGMRVDMRAGLNEVSRHCQDFAQSTIAANAAQMNDGIPFVMQFGGTGTEAFVASTATERGIFNISSGTSSASSTKVGLAMTGSGQPPIFLNQSEGWRLRVRWSGPSALSDGSQTFRLFAGLGTTVDASSPDSIGFEYTQVTDTHWLFTTKTTGGGATTQASPTTVAADINTFLTHEMVHWPGETTVSMLENGATVGTTLSNLPFGVALSYIVSINKSLGSTARTFNVSQFCFENWYPAGRGSG